MIRKEAYVHKSVMEELKRIIDDSEITKEDDALWPPPDRVGRQELEIVIGDEHISFTTSKIGSLIDVNQSKHWFMKKGKEPIPAKSSLESSFSKPTENSRARQVKEGQARKRQPTVPLTNAPLPAHPH